MSVKSDSGQIINTNARRHRTPKLRPANFKSLVNFKDNWDNGLKSGYLVWKWARIVTNGAEISNKEDLSFQVSRASSMTLINLWKMEDLDASVSKLSSSRSLILIKLSSL
ncbi:hypothetical protein WICPIJ_005363 [Wickerhamomyces pijperi]|uniref:Uncharacterized protein n=1 Tax=Wickerhamomyces pijperi TaxID=599730 RepID=A0A9P8Q6B8_WICPI|nr:hypothetical protein WICPIJ_005363 [Wickerhamomyces pijperi]